MSGERLVERSERFAAAEAVRRAQTRQGRFEAGFLSLDWIDAKGDLRDYGDCGRAERQLFRLSFHINLQLFLYGKLP